MTKQSFAGKFFDLFEEKFVDWCLLVLADLSPQIFEKILTFMVTTTSVEKK